MPIDILDWESALNNLDANHQFSVFNSIIMNVVTNFIANETMSCYDRAETLPGQIVLQKPYPC